jgi:hypothetical protein
LPPEKQQHVSEALRRFPKVTLGMDPTPEEQANAVANRRARLSYLSQFLTPEELLDYRMTQDGNTAGVSSFLAGIAPSEQEFRKVFEVLDGESLNRTNGYLSPELEAGLKEALGEIRYAEYQKDMESGNVLLRSWARSSQLTDDQIQQLIALRAAAQGMDAQKYDDAVANIIKDRHVLERYRSNPVLGRARSSKDRGT